MKKIRLFDLNEKVYKRESFGTTGKENEFERKRERRNLL